MKYREGFKYQLVETEVFYTEIKPPEKIVTHFAQLTPNGVLTVKHYYAWDGASGPTFDKEMGWGWFKVKLTDTQVPTLVHDVFAQLMRMGLLDQKWLGPVNKLLDKMLKDRGMWWIRRRLWKRGLWLTGGSFADPKNQKPILTAP